MQVSAAPTIFGIAMIAWAVYNYVNCEKMAKIHSRVSNVFGSGFTLSPSMVKVSSVIGMIIGIIVMGIGITGLLK